MGHLLQTLISLPTLRQLFKFSIVGCLNVGVSFAIFYLCYEKWHLATVILASTGVWGSRLMEGLQGIGTHSIDGTFANLVGYIGGMINSFLLNKLWTFKVRNGMLMQIRRFFVLNVFGLTLSTMIIFVFIDLLGTPYVITWFCAIPAVMTLNFLGSKYWTFTEDSIGSRSS